ncbi:MAG TPA: VanZ family protein [Pelomicrobium sp.]|nr:VanZ family protein [Pelomicrobium sp.]
MPRTLLPVAMPADPSTPRPFRLSIYLALAYLLLVAYASLSPLGGWRLVEGDWLRFVTAPWPRYWTVADLAINALAYFPLGFLIGLSAPRRWPRWAVVALATLLGLLTSFAMETAQQAVPGRVASNLDLMSNGAGALAGALAAAAALSRPATLTALVGLRDRWLDSGHLTDAALVLVALWCFGQANPALPWMATRVFEGALTASARDPAAAFSLLAMALSLTCTLAVAMTLKVVVPPERRRLLLAAAPAVVSALVKSIAAVALLRQEATLRWLTVESVVGVGYGIAFAWLALRHSQRVQAAVGVAAAVAAIVLAYGFEPAASPSAVMRLFSWRYGHLLNFNGLTRLVAELWPMAAIVFLALVLRLRARAR